MNGDTYYTLLGLAVLSLMIGGWIRAGVWKRRYYTAIEGLNSTKEKLQEARQKNYEAQ